MSANLFAAIRPSPGTDRRDPSPGNRRGAMVGANHVGEFIRRYSLLFAHMFAAYRKQKKPHPWLWVRFVREG